MFIGHFALGLAAKRAAPAVSLGTLFLACQLADLIWPSLVLLGIERVAIVPGITEATPLDFQYYPYSHSLLALAGWGVLVALIYRGVRSRASVGTLVLIAALVVSHWVLDAISHRPDMPYTLSGSDRVGLELWASRSVTMVVEGVMLLAGLWLYLKATRAKDQIGVWAFWSLVVFLVVINVINMFGPPPPSPAAVAWTVQALWLVVAWAYWVDRHREGQRSNV